MTPPPNQKPGEELNLAVARWPADVTANRSRCRPAKELACLLVRLFGHNVALSKSQNLIFGTFWPGKSGKAEKNPLTNTSNNKLGHWYLYFNPCSVKLGEGLTSFGTYDDVIDP